MTVSPMATTATIRPTHLLGRLAAVSEARGPFVVTSRLRELEAWIADDLAALPRGDSLERLAACHQLDLSGKLLRPMLVAMASQLGRGFGPEACHAAVAVELIHNATLLHDDVIDLAERRRGAPAARATYGNAASVLAGDWLLVEALKRIQRCGEPGLLDRALATIEEMVTAEALQLENRGRVNVEEEEYFRIIDGKTAALFRWAMFAGATTGGLPSDQRSTLERYGEHLGVAFQLADDLLDVSGDPASTGKAAFTDLREGKITYPLLLVLKRDESLKREVERLLERETDAPLPAPLCRRLKQRLMATGSVNDCRTLARAFADKATACLTQLPETPDRQALGALAVVAADRER